VVETQVCESRDQVCEFFHGRVSWDANSFFVGGFIYILH
jgi:hypothetical protein